MLYVDTFCFLFFYKVKLTESGNRMWLPGAKEAKEMERSWSKGTKLQLQLIKFWGRCHSMVITGNTTYCTLKFAKTVDHRTLFTIFAYVKSSCCHFKYIMILFVNYIPIKLGGKKKNRYPKSFFLFDEFLKKLEEFHLQWLCPWVYDVSLAVLLLSSDPLYYRTENSGLGWGGISRCLHKVS